MIPLNAKKFISSFIISNINYKDGLVDILLVDLDVVNGTEFLLTSNCSASILLSIWSLDRLNSSNLLFNKILNSDLDDCGSGISSIFSSSTS